MQKEENKLCKLQAAVIVAAMAAFIFGLPTTPNAANAYSMIFKTFSGKRNYIHYTAYVLFMYIYFLPFRNISKCRIYGVFKHFVQEFHSIFAHFL